MGSRGESEEGIGADGGSGAGEGDGEEENDLEVDRRVTRVYHGPRDTSSGLAVRSCREGLAGR